MCSSQFFNYSLYFDKTGIEKFVIFPIGLQAIIDMMGPGISNIIYSYFSNKQLRQDLIDPYDYEEYASYTSVKLLALIVLVRGKSGCILTFLRSVLNEYATGLCVVSSAFFRYCLICHPTRNILTKKFLRCFPLLLWWP